MTKHETMIHKGETLPDVSLLFESNVCECPMTVDLQCNAVAGSPCTIHLSSKITQLKCLYINDVKYLQENEVTYSRQTGLKKNIFHSKQLLTPTQIPII